MVFVLVLSVLLRTSAAAEPADTALDQIFRRLDASGDKSVTFAEFSAGVTQPKFISALLQALECLDQQEPGPSHRLAQAASSTRHSLSGDVNVSCPPAACCTLSILAPTPWLIHVLKTGARVAAQVRRLRRIR
jgi:hypothetical protein